MATGMNGPLRWYGGKRRLAKKLLKLMPDHRSYVEVFAGGAALFYAREPKGLEVLNDLDEGITNFYRVLRDEKLLKKFHFAISLTPYSQAEFEFCKKSWWKCEDPVEKARRWFAVNRMCFGGIMGGGFARSKKGLVYGHSTLNGFLKTIDRLPEIHERLSQVHIDRQDFREVVKRYDNSEAFFYLDPPYVHDTRKTKSDYAHEMTNEDHEDLVEMLLRIKGKVMLSGYVNDIYGVLETAGWERRDYQAVCTVAPNQAKDRNRIESVWMNYPAKA